MFVNDLTDPLERPSGVFTGSVGAFHLERPLKICKLTFEGSFPVTLLSVHGVYMLE